MNSLTKTINQLKTGVLFDGTETIIPWSISVEKLVDYLNPEVTVIDAHVEVNWRETSLLGILGDWGVDYYSFEGSQEFQQIQLRVIGDNPSKEKFTFFSEHLINLIGTPDIEEYDEEKELTWFINDLIIRLYFFEMHCYRCYLSVGVK